MTQVKICGLRHPSHAQAAAEAGADFIGLVFAPSKRQVDEGQAGEITQALKGRGTLTVGIFVNTPAAEVNRIAQSCGLDWVQLSGDESWGYMKDIERPIIKAVKVGKGQSGEDIMDEIRRGEAMGVEFTPLLDCAVAGSYGGSGQAFDWDVAREVSQRFPLILAGGLSPDNVSHAITTARPWGVDISSGVESGGEKDTAKITTFIEAVRAADRELDRDPR